MLCSLRGAKGPTSTRGRDRSFSHIKQTRQRPSRPSVRRRYHHDTMAQPDMETIESTILEIRQEVIHLEERLTALLAKL